MTLSAGKLAEVMLESAQEAYEHQDLMLPLVDRIEPEAGSMQNSGNIVWEPVQQHAPIIEGWDLTGLEQDIIEETYPMQLGTPTNDFVQQRADDMRDRRFWERRAKQSGKQQATELNRQIAAAMALQGAVFYRSNAASGFDFISEGQTLLNERQTYDSGRSYLLNDRDTQLYASELSGRETVKGRPEVAWNNGQIGSQVAQFDIYTGSFLPNLTGGADPATTVTGNQSFAPEAGSVNTATGVVTNVDYRIATIPVAASAGYTVGDKVQYANAGTAVTALGKADKTDTNVAMTFTIVGIPDGTSVQIYPKPSAYDDPALSTLEKQYANIDTRILNAATMNRVNIDASNRTNLFWDKEAVKLVSGTIPAGLFKEFDGMKVINTTMKNGQTMYMVYDGNIATMSFRYRLFTWHGITIADPSRVGVSVTF